MIQPDDFKYRIVIGREPFDLIQSPIGWEDNLIKFTRNSTYFGIIRDYTVPLKFVTEGAKILRSQYYQFGIEAFVRIEILQLNRNTWEYQQLYIGEIDFSKVEDDKDGFTCNVMEGGISKLIKAYENVKYEIDLDVPEAVNTRLPGIGFNDYSNSIIQPNNGGDYYPGITLVINELAGAFMVAQSTALVNGDTPDLNQWFLRSNSNNTLVRIKGNFIGQYSFNSFGILRILIVSYIGSTLTFQRVLFQRNINSANRLGSIDTEFDFNYTPALNERFFFWVTSTGVSNFTEINEGRIDISYSTASEEIECKTLRPKYVLEQILQKMNENRPVPVRSFVLDNTKWRDVVLTSGNGIRGLQGSKIKTSLKDFFQSYSSQICAGIGIENEVLVFEERNYFYAEIVQIADVGDVKDCKFQPAGDYFFSSLKVGYKNQNYEENNGRDEFNAGQEWTFPITRVTKDLNLVSIYRADVRGIEEIRRKLIETEETTNDAESDNDVFMIKLKSQPEIDGFYKPEGFSDYRSVTGVENPERMYNLDLSPKKMLLRNSPFIDSFLSGLAGTLIRFQSADKNAELTTIDLNGNYVKENEDIQTDTLTGAYFLPIEVTFTANSPRNIQYLINQTPYGVIQFTYFGNVYKGFVLEISSDVSRNEEREFKLLLTASNNLLNLIR